MDEFEIRLATEIRARLSQCYAKLVGKKVKKKENKSVSIRGMLKEAYLSFGIE